MAVSDDIVAKLRSRAGLTALALGFLLLISVIGGVGWLTHTGAEADRLVAHTLTVRQKISQLLNVVVEAETAQRGYMLTLDESYLAPVAKAALAPTILTELRALTDDNPAQTARIDDIAPAIARRLEIIETTSALTRQGRRAQAVALVRTNEGAQLMAKIRATTQAMDAEEQRLFAERTAHAAQQRGWLTAAMILLVGVFLAISAGVFLSLRDNLLTLATANRALTQEMRERASAEAQLRQAQKMESLGRLTGGVAHDFNNMLAIVVGSLDLLLRRMGEADARNRDLAQQALEGAKRASALTQRLLAFSRQQPLEPRVVDVNKVAAEMMVLLQRTLGEQVHVETVQAGGLWRTFIDRPQLESAILNLAVNARDAMAEGGKLTIETANTYLDEAYAAQHGEVTAGQYVLVAVTDTGAGMTPEVMESAFEPFFTTKAQGVGTGLGLSQVHGFIKQSGGHVKIYSEPGVGTTVKLYLPRYLGAAEPDAAPARPAERTPLSCTVLVVEDEDGVRRFVMEALDELGCRAIEAANADEALAKLRAAPDVAVLLTDVVMPGRSGRQLADEAAKLRPDLRIIFMTGYTRNAIVHNGALDAGTQLMTKPFTLAQLEFELHRALMR